jgi:LmbE family N-acetylglucosaminyl deacetylase
MAKSNNILVVAAHPDDELLGCGGTLARHCNDGDKVETLILAEGVTSRDDEREKEQHRSELTDLHKAAYRAAEIIGAALPEFGGLPDNRMDQLDLLDVVKLIEKAISRHAPTIIYTHHGGDLNIDHRITHQAVMTACRPLPDSITEAIYCFETPSSTEWADASQPEFKPNHFVEITATLDVKLSALEAYNTEMRPFPHPRSPEAIAALAKWRGASCGVVAAEAFSVAQRIIRQ